MLFAGPRDTRCTLIVLAERKEVGGAATYDNDLGVTLVTATNRRNPPQCLDSTIHHNNLLNNILVGKWCKDFLRTPCSRRVVSLFCGRNGRDIQLFRRLFAFNHTRVLKLEPVRRTHLRPCTNTSQVLRAKLLLPFSFPCVLSVRVAHTTKTSRRYRPTSQARRTR